MALDLGVDTSTPAGEMMANVLATFAQFERRLIGQRTRDALAIVRPERFEVRASDRDPNFVRIDAEIEREILALRAAGWSFARVAEALNMPAYLRRETERVGTAKPSQTFAHRSR